jgi:hypothetical protein
MKPNEAIGIVHQVGLGHLEFDGPDGFIFVAAKVAMIRDTLMMLSGFADAHAASSIAAECRQACVELSGLLLYVGERAGVVVRDPRTAK